MIMLILGVAIGLSLFMSLAWAYQRHVNNAGWVDVFWTAGLGIAAVAVALAPIPGTVGLTGRQELVAAMAAFWSLRLGTHLGVRVAHHAEDVRYANFRKEWGADYQRRMFIFLQIQALAAIILALCILAAARNPAPGIGVKDWIGVLVLVVAIGGEGIADGQLRRFKANPANKGGICDVGLWRWSRHPNYFFEWLVWAGFAVIAIDFSGQYLWGWLSLFGPISMYWLLVYVSGIPPLETLMLKSRGDAYRAYQSNTHAFFPLPPRHSSPAKTAHP